MKNFKSGFILLGLSLFVGSAFGSLPESLPKSQDPVIRVPLPGPFPAEKVGKKPRVHQTTLHGAAHDPVVKGTGASALTSPVFKTSVKSWCEKVAESFVKFKWGKDPCSQLDWIIGGYSVKGMPLVYADFGEKDADNVTLVFATVHGDEVTPLYLAMQLAAWVKERQSSLGKSRIVIAPLVNPDGFFSRPRTRVNARGVDINRNFATHDWKKIGLRSRNPRRFPGHSPSSEPETLFQENLIRAIRPQKILSVHSPLNFMDYDGPGTFTLSKFPKDYTRECNRLRKQLKAISGGFYPGSLGNFAGFELGIPTLTLELPSADASKAKEYWERFTPGIQTMIDFTVPIYTAAGTFRKEAGG